MLRVGDGLVAVLIIVTAVLWREMGERSAAINPWVLDGTTVRLQQLLSWCVGGRSECSGSGGGTAEIWVPLLLNGTWLLDAAASGSLRVSVNGTALLYVTAAGTVIVGPTEPDGASGPGTVVGLVPVAEVVTAMWASHGRLQIGSDTLVDAVCHVGDATLCGTLLRTGPGDPGTFWSGTRIIVGKAGNIALHA